MEIFNVPQSNRYYNIPPIGGYQVDEEYNYVFVDDISSMLFLELVTQIHNNKETVKDQLKKIKYHRVKDNLLETSCSICIDNFQLGEYQRTLCCSHVFHKKCIDRWFKKNKTDCPMCRTKIIN